MDLHLPQRETRHTDSNTLAYTQVCSLTLSCTGLEVYSVWRQIPLDFCSFWNYFSALLSAGRLQCLQIVPLSLPLGMFIKFPHSLPFFLLSIVLALALLNRSAVLTPDAPLTFCVRKKVQYGGGSNICCVYPRRCFKLSSSATKEERTRFRPGTVPICYIKALVNTKEKPFPALGRKNLC